MNDDTRISRKTIYSWLKTNEIWYLENWLFDTLSIKGALKH